MLGYNKKYATLSLNYILNNPKETILVSEIERKDRKHSIKEK